MTTMKLPLIILLLICAYVGGATNLFENNKLQSRLRSDLKEEQTDFINSLKPLPLFRRETVSESKRKRCENCRKLKRCKVYQKCDICNVACKDVNIAQLDTPEIAIVGDMPENVIKDSSYTTNVQPFNDSSSNFDRFDTVENTRPGPKHNILTRILEQPNEDSNRNESFGLIDTANAFNKNNDELELNAKAIQVANEDTQAESELRTKIEKKVNMPVKEKKRLLNDSKLTKDEQGKIDGHAKLLFNRKSNREGLLNLRSRSIVNKDNHDQSNESKQNIDSSKEKEKKAQKLKGKPFSMGQRRKFNDHQSNIQNFTSEENFSSKLNDQLEPEEIKFPIMDLPSTTEKNIKESSNTVTQLQNLSNSQNSNEFNEDDVLQLKHDEAVLTPEKFSAILKSLEEKVEGVADLVRKTCHQPITTNSDVLRSTESNILPILKKKSFEPLIQENQEKEKFAQKGENDFQTKLINLDDELSTSTNTNVFLDDNSNSTDIINNDEEEHEPIKLSTDDSLNESSTIATQSRFNSDDINLEQALTIKEKESLNDLPIESKLDLKDENETLISHEQQESSKELFVTESNHGLPDNILSPKSIETNEEKVTLEKSEEDNIDEKKITSKNNEEINVIKDPHNIFNDKSSKESFRKKEERNENEENMSKHKHDHFMQEPHQPPDIEQLFDRSAVHENPHQVLSDSIPVTNQKDDELLSDNDANNLKTYLSNNDSSTLRDDVLSENIEDNTTVLPALEQRFAENVGKSKDSKDEKKLSFDLNEVERDIKKGNTFSTSHPFGVIGKIIPQDPNSKNKVTFVSNSMQLPFNIKKDTDGSYQISFDLEKLCPSCNSGTCKSMSNNDEHKHKINKRDLQKSNAVTNTHKKRKPFPLEKKKLIKIKRSTNSDLQLKDSKTYKLLNSLLNNSFDKNQNILSKSSIFEKSYQNKINKQNIDATQQKINLVNNVLTWWKSFIEDKV